MHGSQHKIVTLPEKDWTTATNNVHRKCGEVWLCCAIPETCEPRDGQIDRRSSWWERSSNGINDVVLFSTWTISYLPSDVTSALTSLSVFKNRLKAYLFRRCYEPVWLWMTFPFPSHYLASRTVVLAIVIPAKARDYVFTGVGLSVCLSVCLFVCYHDN